MGSDVGIRTPGLPWLFNGFPVTRGKRLGLRPLFLTLDMVLTNRLLRRGGLIGKGVRELPGVKECSLPGLACIQLSKTDQAEQLKVCSFCSLLIIV